MEGTMLDNDRLRADAEDAEVFSKMARIRLLAAQASCDRLAARWKDAQARRRATAQGDRPQSPKSLTGRSSEASPERGSATWLEEHEVSERVGG
jgi:hypothetical protein